MKVNEIITEAANPAQQAAIAISMKKAGKKPRSQVNELAPSPGGPDSGDYFRTLASAWYNGAYDSGSLQKGIKTNQDIERLLQRGIVAPDGVARKYNIDYNSDFDGVIIFSDDYYEHGDHDDTDSRTGKPFGPYDYMEFSDDELSEGIYESAELVEEFDLIESIIERLAAHNGVDADVIWEDLENLTEDELYAFAVTSEPIMESQDVAEDANLNYIWIQGDFDGDTASSGATQGSWRDQQSTPVKLTRGRMINVRPLSGPPPEGGKTIKQAQIPLTLDAGEQKFSTTGVDLQLTVAPNGYITNGEVGRVRGTAVVKIMRPESVEEDLTRRGFLRGLGAAALAGAAGGALAGSNDPNFVRKVHDQHNAMIEKNPRYAKEHDALGIYLARGIAGASAENNKRWVEKTAKLLQKYGVNVNEGMAEDWQKANKRDRTAGMSQKAVNAYRRENPGSKLKTAVTTKPSKLKKGGKASKRRKSYCSRSRGQMKMHSISCAKTPDKAICKARRRWNC
jgi:hypothetical protein